MDAPERISFIASLPSIQSAISISGDGLGARVKIDIPQTEADVIPLIQLFYSGVAFKVTMERIESRQSEDEQHDRTTRRRTRKKRER